MTEEGFREESLRIEQARLILDERRFALENTFAKRHFGALLAALVTVVIAIVSSVQLYISSKNNEAGIVNARVERDARLVTRRRSEGRDSDLINLAGTMYRFSDSQRCAAGAKISLSSDGKLSIGLVSTNLTNNEATILVPGGAPETFVVRVGGVGVVEVQNSTLNVAISHVSECTADYRVWKPD